MAKAFIVHYEVLPTGRRKVHAVLQWGGAESLNPRDVGLQTIDSIVLSPQNITTVNQPLPIGSVPLNVAAPSGSPGPQGRVRGPGPGSTITIRWFQGSTGTRLATAQTRGTASSGTKSAHAIITGA